MCTYTCYSVFFKVIIHKCDTSLQQASSNDNTYNLYFYCQYNLQHTEMDPTLCKSNRLQIYMGAHWTQTGMVVSVAYIQACTWINSKCIKLYLPNLCRWGHARIWFLVQGLVESRANQERPCYIKAKFRTFTLQKSLLLVQSYNQ